MPDTEAITALSLYATAQLHLAATTAQEAAGIYQENYTEGETFPRRWADAIDALADEGRAARDRATKALAIAAQLVDRATFNTGNEARYLNTSSPTSAE